jgi:hypothetical protein
MRTFGRYIVPVLAAATAMGLAAGAAASVGPARLIGGSSVGGARLGMARAAYGAILGKPTFSTRYADGTARLTFRNGAVHVYLTRSTRRGFALMTADERYRTSAGVGPCSSITQLRHAYGGSLTAVRLSRNGRTVGYRWRALLFVVNTNRVGLVMLASRTVPVRLAVNAASCGIGEEG